MNLALLASGLLFVQDAKLPAAKNPPPAAAKSATPAAQAEKPLPKLSPGGEATYIVAVLNATDQEVIDLLERGTESLYGSACRHVASRGLEFPKRGYVGVIIPGMSEQFADGVKCAINFTVMLEGAGQRPAKEGAREFALAAINVANSRLQEVVKARRAGLEVRAEQAQHRVQVEMQEATKARRDLPVFVRLHDAASYRLHLRTLTQKWQELKVQHAGAAAQVAVLEKAIQRDAGKGQAASRAALRVHEVELENCRIQLVRFEDRHKKGIIAAGEVQAAQANVLKAQAMLDAKLAEAEAKGFGSELAGALAQQLELANAKLAELEGQIRAMPDEKQLLDMEKHLVRLEEIDRLMQRAADAEAEARARQALEKLPPPPSIEILRKL